MRPPIRTCGSWPSWRSWSTVHSGTFRMSAVSWRFISISTGASPRGNKGSTFSSIASAGRLARLALRLFPHLLGRQFGLVQLVEQVGHRAGPDEHAPRRFLRGGRLRRLVPLSLLQLTYALLPL